MNEISGLTTQAEVVKRKKRMSEHCLQGITIAETGRMSDGATSRVKEDLRLLGRGADGLSSQQEVQRTFYKLPFF